MCIMILTHSNSVDIADTTVLAKDTILRQWNLNTELCAKDRAEINRWHTDFRLINAALEALTDISHRMSIAIEKEYIINDLDISCDEKKLLIEYMNKNHQCNITFNALLALLQKYHQYKASNEAYH